jgi:tRNA(His) 5'-end guanylyltransferase
MRPDEFESRMRALEVFHALRLPPAAWVILRLDGRGFSRFTETRFEKPFDARFHDTMVQTAQAILEDLQGLYAYTESDEISVLFPRTWDLFDRELEKAVSLSAATASATFSLACGTRVNFDSRGDPRRRGRAGHGLLPLAAS